MSPEDMKLVIADLDDEILFADGFEDALIGYVSRCSSPITALYDRAKCIDILMERDGMTHEEAEEYFQYNVEGAWVGEYTPFLATILREDD